MKIMCVGVQRIIGTSKAGNAFDMCNLLVLVPVEQVQNAKVKIIGGGYKQMEIPLDPEQIPVFAPRFAQGPVVLDVAMESRPNRGKFETTVVGLAAPVAKAA